MTTRSKYSIYPSKSRKMRAVVIDDEKNCIDVIAALTRKYTDDLEIIGTFQNGQDALEEIDALRPDLVFLDIEMPIVNGFEFLERTNYKEFKIIFTTAYNEYAIKAIRHHAFDYLLKPIQRKEFINTIVRLRKEGTINTTNEIDQLLEYMSRQGNSNKIVVSTSEGMHFLSLDEIMYVKAEGAYSCFFKDTGGKLLVSKTLKEVDELISSSHFLRVHASYIVNFEFIQRYLRGEGGYLELTNSDRIPVSRSRKTELLSFMERLNQ